MRISMNNPAPILSESGSYHCGNCGAVLDGEVRYTCPLQRECTRCGLWNESRQCAKEQAVGPRQLEALLAYEGGSITPIIDAMVLDDLYKVAAAQLTAEAVTS